MPTSKNESANTASSRKATSTHATNSESETPPRDADGRFRSASSIPPWATTVASVVGVGVAVGAGLFATRRQWMPQAERLTGQIAARFRSEDNSRDSDDFYADGIADQDERWNEDEGFAEASFPDRDIYPASRAMS